MMNYEIFKEVVVVEKVNVTMDGISLMDSSGAAVVTPTIYINTMYEYFFPEVSVEHMRAVRETKEAMH